MHEPRVRYLSQQFVERLSSPTGLADELLDEIERVVFDAIPVEDRLLCSTFAELRDGSLQDATAQRDADREVIRSRTTAIAEEHRLSRAIPALKAKVQEAERDRAAIEKELAAIPLQASNELVKAHRDATERLTKLQEAIAAESLRARELVEVASEFRRHVRAADEAHTSLKATYGDLLDATAWERLRVRADETALAVLADLKKKADDRVARLRAQGVNADENAPPGPGPEGIVALTAACDKATKALGEDLAQAKRRSELEKKLAVAKQAEEQQKKRLTNAEGSPKRQRASSSERYEAYERIFMTLGGEAESLEHLYQPLRTRLEADERLRNLSFFVRRHVALDEWVERGEALLDLRKPPFQGAGALADAARTTLLSAWEKGTASEARAAMEKFASDHSAALSALRREATPLEFGEWLFSTDHISVQYGIRYEGVDLGSLSPGARGVVLLTLYLALDDVDTRPLVIDQPEENLDPKSVYAYLVPFFRDAARRRQIIMVTHNANLVVNSDSDQVIVAEAERKSPIELPRIQYSAGGLEDSRIRGLVCQYLEGGVEAFRRRGQRYGVGASG